MSRGVWFSACPICRGASSLWRCVGEYKLIRCSSCGFVFVNPRPGREELTQFYRSHGGHFGDQPGTLAEAVEQERLYPNSTIDARRIISIARRAAHGRGRLLDIGCGYGFFTHEAIRAGFAVDAIEVSPLERSIAHDLTGISPLDVAFEDFEGPPSSYAVLLMSQVLEHVVDVNAWIQRAATLLRANGVLCIAVPNFSSLVRRLLNERDPLVNPPTHLNYFSKRNLHLLLRKHGFQPFKSQTISRIPPTALSKRLPRALARFDEGAQQVVRYGQRPVVAALDALGVGIFLNVFAERPS